MGAFFCGILLGLVLAVALLVLAVILLVRGNRAAAAHFLQGMALVLKPKAPERMPEATPAKDGRLV